MKRITIIALALAIGLQASAQESAVSYALPKTTLHFEVEATLEKFYAGPYAKYAQKYLGTEARQQDENICHISSIKLTPCVEADQSARYTTSFSSKGGGMDSFLKLSTQGLVSVSDGNFGQESIWRFPAVSKADFSDKGVSSNLTSESTVLYKNVREQSAYNKVSVQQNMVVAKSLEDKAREAAEMLINLRNTRVAIVTGDTDATYSGEAMSAVINEIMNLEKEYLSLFMGYSDYQPQTGTFDVVPEAGTNMYIAFRASETGGLVSSDYATGKPYILEVNPEAVPAQAASRDRQAIRYRIPAVCSIKLMDGTKVLVQSRIPVYQMGVEAVYPAN